MSSLEELIARREQILKDNPHLQSYQDEIEKVMQKTPAALRPEVLSMMAAGLSQKLQQQLNILLKEVSGDTTSKV